MKDMAWEVVDKNISNTEEKVQSADKLTIQYSRILRVTLDSTVR